MCGWRWREPRRFLKKSRLWRRPDHPGRLRWAAGRVCILVRDKKTEKPPKLYDLTTLQREANRVFGYTAKQTLNYAQSLYEKKLLTIPARTAGI